MREYKRKSIRLKDYDYTQNGLYFITINSYKNQYWFGDILNEKLIISKIGIMIQKQYFELEKKYKNIECHDLIIMPNHIHFIVEIQKNIEDSKNIKIGEVIGFFKYITTKKYNKIIKQYSNYQKLWHRNYYDYIIRKNELKRVQEYIENNPKNWETEKLRDPMDFVKYEFNV